VKRRRLGEAGEVPYRVASDVYELNYLQRELERARVRHRHALAALEGADRAVRRDAAKSVERMTLASTEIDPQVRLCDATFEDLRRLGLSVTQSSRLLRLRDQNALRSIDDLDEVPGIPNVLLKELRSQLRD
jgi:DNA uptake protein ComE-like DNA-binding protein